MLVLGIPASTNEYSLDLLNAAIPLIVLVFVFVITIAPLATSLFDRIRLHGYQRPVVSQEVLTTLPMGKYYDDHDPSSTIRICKAVPRCSLIIIVFACLSVTYLISLSLTPFYGHPIPHLYLFDSLANMLTFMLFTIHLVNLYHKDAWPSVLTHLFNFAYLVIELSKLLCVLLRIDTIASNHILFISSLSLIVSRIVILSFLACLQSRFLYKRVTVEVTHSDPRPIKPRQKISSFGGILRQLRIISPFIWPRHSWLLQLVAVLCFALLLAGRVIAMSIPLALKSVVTHLGDKTSPWLSLACYIILYPLNGHGGIPSALQTILWHISVAQYCERAVSQLVFEHLLNLSLSFHKRKKIGELIRVLQRKESLNRLLETFLFKVIPIVFDVAIAIIYISWEFGLVLACIVFLVMATYLIVTLQLSSARIKFRREKNEEDKYLYGIETDAIINWEAVKCFTAERHEVSRYMNYFFDYQRTRFNVIVSLSAILMIQSIIFSFAAVFGCVLIVQEVMDNVKTIGDFVLFTSLLHQISVPLAMLANEYRTIQMRLIDTEQLLNVLAEEPEITDIPNATTLKNAKGEIIFDNVSFEYEKNGKGVRNVSFKIPAGSSVAFVGESGGGKSTILRLLYRFYDVDEGSIRIDGNDIREVTQNSLRSNISIVPQEVGLANETIKHNIAYGNMSASDEQIIQAAKDARIHDRILEFPMKYGTVAGERGVRLSGGERQRIGIARALLKNPAVLLFDEATSAIDSSSALDIQNTLDTIASGKTTITVAHKLHTVMMVDQIFVMNDGEIVESGTHNSLLLRGGYYAKLWNDQLRESLNGDAMGSGSMTPARVATQSGFRPVLASRPTTPDA